VLEDRSDGSAHLPTRSPAHCSAAATPGSLTGTTCSRRMVLKEGQANQLHSSHMSQEKGAKGNGYHRTTSKGQPNHTLSLAMIKILKCLISFCSVCADTTYYNLTFPHVVELETHGMLTPNCPTGALLMQLAIEDHISRTECPCHCPYLGSMYWPAVASDGGSRRQLHLAQLRMETILAASARFHDDGTNM